MSTSCTGLNEDELCSQFAEGVKDRPEFARWILKRTKFGAFAARCCLLSEEQMSIRPREQWWRHWWCHVPELSKDRETDIFMVFEVQPEKTRFALHIENKRDTYRFSPGQAAAYAPRGRYMSGKAKFLSYADFATVLLAPISFEKRFKAECALFDTFLPYEEISQFLPAFTVGVHTA